MNFESAFAFLFFGVFALAAGAFIFKMIKHGGLRAALFGAPIECTVGEVAVGRVKLLSIAVRVHTLGGGAPDKAIGLEIVAKTFASFQMMPVTLSASEARKLATLLQSATAGSNAT